MLTTAIALACFAQLTPSTGADAAEDLSLRFTPEVQVVREARPAVVSIQADVVQVGRDIFGRRVEQRGTSNGSGVVIYDDGWVVTNYHVVRGASNIRVSQEPAVGEPAVEYPARLVSSVAEEDLALLKIETEEQIVFPTVPLGTSADLMVAEPVLAIGNPYNQTLTVSRGIISGLHRDIVVQAEGLRFSNLIQTDASINPGNSGGPLLNIYGQLIGINTVVNRQAENIGFAIPVDRVRQVLEESLLAPSLAASWYGFTTADEPDGDAFEVVAVVAGSPADEAGIQVGDDVLGWDGRRFVTSEAFRLARAALEPGVPTRFEVRRDGRVRALALEGWSREVGLVYERAGFRPRTMVVQQGLRRQYLTHVGDLRPGGPAEQLGLREGDLIESFQARGRQVLVPNSPQILALYLNALQDDAQVEIDVWRDENENGRLDYTADVTELLRGTLVVD